QTWLFPPPSQDVALQRYGLSASSGRLTAPNPHVAVLAGIPPTQTHPLAPAVAGGQCGADPARALPAGPPVVALQPPGGRARGPQPAGGGDRAAAARPGPRDGFAGLRPRRRRRHAHPAAPARA